MTSDLFWSNLGYGVVGKGKDNKRLAIVDNLKLGDDIWGFIMFYACLSLKYSIIKSYLKIEQE